MAVRDKERMMKSRSKLESPTADSAPLNGTGKRRLTFDQIIDKWADVIPPEFWDEVDKARDPYPPPPPEGQ
jgi:hypothetical protein